MEKKLRALIVILSMVFLMGCGSEYASDSKGSYEMSSSESNGFYDDSYDYYSNEVSTEAVEVAESSRKLIKNYSISIETEDFDSIMPAIEARVKELGGYIEQLNTYYGNRYSNWDSRSSSLTIRIPKGKEDEFIGFVGNTSNITRQSLDVSDVTLSYVDMESRKNSYIVERDRLMELLEAADNLEDILTIESRLSEVRYYLESAESQLRTMDNLVDYSTINLSVSEVKQYTEPEPESYGQRLVKSFTSGLSDFITGLKEFSIWFVGAFPTLLFLAIIVVVIIKLRKKFKFKKKAREQKKKDNDDNQAEINEEGK